MDTVKPRKGELRTKFMVATSLAVVKWGSPALGFGSLAMTSLPSSMVSRNTLLNWPSDIFRTFTQDSEPMALAASR